MTREMKNSGVEWIGDIPCEWKIVKVKSIFNIGRGRVIAKTELEDSGYPIYSSQTKNNGILGYIGTYDYDVDQLTWTTDGANAGTVFLRTGKYNCTNVCGTLALKNNLNCLLYMKYALEYIAIFHKRPDTNGYKIMNNEMADIKVTAPPLPEQKRIADFLDIKVTEIDKIISDTKASIENYKEYKQSVITEAVTKGLDKNVPMKDSGVEWIGGIPVDWRLGKIKSCVTKVGSGKTPKGGGDVYSSEGVLFLRSQNVYDTGLVLDDPTYISEEIDEEMKNTRVMDKDVLLNITGGSIGRCCIYDKSYGKANVNQHVSIIRLKQDIMFPEYMHYYWLSSLGKMSVNLYQTGGNREGMSADAIKNSPIIYTSISTQKEIIAFLDSKCAEIDNIILEKEKLITNLEEYKKSLIYEYVTGKKVV